MTPEHASMRSELGEKSPLQGSQSNSSNARMDPTSGCTLSIHSLYTLSISFIILFYTLFIVSKIANTFNLHYEPAHFILRATRASPH